MGLGREMFRERKSRGFGVSYRKNFDWRSNFFSVYVGNVHPLSSRGSLWKIFSNFGIVSDIFFPYQRRSSSTLITKYAFIRFRQEEEAIKAVNGGNNIILDNQHLVVNYAVPHRGDEKLSKTENLVSIKVPAENTGQSSHDDLYCTDGNKKLESSCKASRADSFDIQKGDLPSQPISLDWLHSAAIGRLRTPSSTEVILEALLSQGVDVRLAPITDINVLISFQNTADRARYLQHHACLFDIWFEEIVPWSEEMVERKRLVWLQIKEIPLALWDEVFFKEIVSGWGICLEVADITKRRKLLTAAWLMIEVSDERNIPQVVKGSMNGVKFDILISVVKEEQVPKSYACWPDPTFNPSSGSPSGAGVEEEEEVHELRDFGEGGGAGRLIDVGEEDGVRDFALDLSDGVNVRNFSKPGSLSVGGMLHEDNGLHRLTSHDLKIRPNSNVQVNMPSCGDEELAIQEIGPLGCASGNIEEISFLDFHSPNSIVIGKSKKGKRFRKVKGKKSKKCRRIKARKLKTVVSEVLECSGAVSDVGRDDKDVGSALGSEEGLIAESLAETKRISSESDISVGAFTDGSLMIDLRDFGLTPPAISTSPAKSLNASWSDEKFGLQKGYGGLNRGFLDLGLQHSWNWFRKPRPRRSLKPSEQPILDDSEGAIFLKTRKEAEASFAVSKVLGISFEEDEETVVQAFMEIESEI